MSFSQLEKLSLERLEFPQLLTLIASYCQSDVAKMQLKRYRPASSLTQITRQHNYYRDAMAMLIAMYDIPSLVVADLTPLISRGELSNTIFAGEDLLTFCDLLEKVEKVITLFEDSDIKGHYSHLCQITDQLDSLKQVCELLQRSIAPDGTIKDSATSKLDAIRREQRALSAQIQRSLNAMLKSEGDDVQENFVTERNGRFVIPIRRESKSRFPGIVHDMSNSGRTLFVEPLQTHAAGNELSENRLLERDEVRSILVNCSKLIHQNISVLQQNQKSLVLLDIVFGVASWAVEFHASLPKFGEQISLSMARHPLLDAQFRKTPGKILIPMNLRLPEGIKTLAITGSNTGGKTISLKTTGLLTLMAQSGLPVTADPESTFTIFKHVLVDIGDEQSIDANLSTFSAHLETIKQILNIVQKGKSLVIIDEIGAGTDPIEGAALACAELVELAKYSTLTLVSTHLGAVKMYVHEHEEMINGAVRFNEKTLVPEYALDIGRPGASHALHIAQRLKLPETVLNSATQFLSKDQIKLEKILLDMEETHRETETHRVKLAKLENETAKYHQDLKEEVERLRQERKAILNEAYVQAQAIIDNTRKQVENMQRVMTEKGINLDDLQKASFQKIRQDLQQKQKRLDVGLQQTEQKLAKTIAITSLEVGQKVYIAKLKNYGRILTISDDKKNATVDMGGLKFSIKTAEITDRAPEDKKDKEPAKVTFVKPIMRRQVSTELNLVGCRIDQALSNLNRFLSDATMAGLDEVSVVHGFGTGRLRDAIHEELRYNKIVADYRLGVPHKDNGGNGVTWIKIAR